MGMEIITEHNSTYPKGGVSFSKDSLVVAESSELQTNPDNRVAKKSTHCQYVARYAAF
jgi:hypothetical protein